ncbi:hypothetical protein RKD25_002051 [Streptomyces sp. SAI-124]
MWRCALPPLLRYPTVDELGARAAALVARHPADARLRRAGTSRAGTPLWLLSVGHGSRQALVVAGPHANEPVGGGTALRLAERALADPRLTVGADATWNLLLCLDPDGLRRNEGWLRGPYSLGRYFRNFFRPGFGEQPEWLPDGAEAAALPETRTLLALQDELRPFLQCSLHGVDVGGGFVELTQDLPGLARRVAHTASRLRIPRELGPYDTLYWPSLGPAVYRIPPPRRGDLAAAITEAAVESTWYHPHRYGTVTAVVEAPMWGVAGVEDGGTPADAAAVLRTVSHTLRRDARLLEDVLTRIRPHVSAAPRRGPAARPGRGLFTGLPRTRRRLGPRRPRRRPPDAPAQRRPPGRTAHRRTAPRPAYGRSAAPAGDPRGRRPGRSAAGTGPARRPVVRRLPRRLRGALDPGPAPDRVPVPGGARRLRTRRSGGARPLPFG